MVKAGHEVLGVDVAPAKIEILMEGRSPVIEKDLNELIAGAVDAGTLRAASSAAEAKSPRS